VDQPGPSRSLQLIGSRVEGEIEGRQADVRGSNGTCAAMTKHALDGRSRMVRGNNYKSSLNNKLREAGYILFIIFVTQGRKILAQI